MSDLITTYIANVFHERVNEYTCPPEQSIKKLKEVPFVNDVMGYDGKIEHEYEYAYAPNLLYKDMFPNEDVIKRFESMEAERKKSVETLAEEYQAIQQQQLKERLNEHSYPKSDLDTTTTILLYASIIISLPFLAIMVPIDKVRSLFRNSSKISIE
jgi:hypothetical protein